MGRYTFSHVGIFFSLIAFYAFPNPSSPNTVYPNFPPDPEQVEIIGLDKINSRGTDFSPVPYRNGLVFTSSRNDEEGVGVSGIFKEKFFDLYYSDRNEHGNYVVPRMVSGDINSELHDGTATFSRDGFTMYFTRNRALSENKGLVALKIYSAELIGGQWTNVVELPFNSEKFSNSHPTLSSDGQRLYFASNRPGGYGGMDIYVVEKKGGSWSKPRNAGASVNTSANETFPFMADDDLLYYASDRTGGRGKMDIYMNELIGKVFGAGKNIGAPFNSSADDFGFYIDAKKQRGFLSSNRSGGKGKDDIYEWRIKEDLSKVRKMILVDKLSGKRITNAEVRMKAGMHNSAAERLEEIKQGVYKMELDGSDGYTFNVENFGYRPLRLVFQKEDLEEKDEHILYLHKKSMSLLSGTVVHKKTSQILAKAKVELISECDGRRQFATTTENGTFGFSLICDCEYTIVVNKEGFKTSHIVIPTHKNKCHGSNLLKEQMELEPVSIIKDRASIIKP